MLKALVAAACVVVIACGGMFLWRDHQRAAELAERQARVDMVADCTKALADLKPYNYETPEIVSLRNKVVSCRMNGLISDAAWQAKISG